MVKEEEKHANKLVTLFLVLSQINSSLYYTCVLRMAFSVAISKAPPCISWILAIGCVRCELSYGFGFLWFLFVTFFSSLFFRAWMRRWIS